MKDPRITVRLSEEMHEKFRIISIKRKTSMTKILEDYIAKLIEEDDKNEKND